MGNNCCSSKEDLTPQGTVEGGILRKEPQKMKIYGDFFNGDSRAIHAMLKHSGVDFEWLNIDTLGSESADQEFKTYSPNGHVPVLVSDDSVAILSGFQLYDWVLKQEELAGNNATLDYVINDNGTCTCKLCGEVTQSRTHWYRHKYKVKTTICQGVFLS